MLGVGVRGAGMALAEGVAPQFPSDPGHVWTCALQVALPPAGPTAEARPTELHVQTCSETALLAPEHPLLPPAIRCPQAPLLGGMEAHEQGKCEWAPWLWPSLDLGLKWRQGEDSEGNKLSVAVLLGRYL